MRLLIVESGDQNFRGYILQTLYKNDFKIVLLKQSNPTWEQPFIEDTIITDFENETEVLSAVTQFHLTRPFDGIFTYVEFHVELTARLAKVLGLRFFSEESAHYVRNKYLMRQQLLNQGLRTPLFTKVVGEVETAMSHVGFPLVIKPVYGTASINVIKITGESDVNKISSIINGNSSIVLDIAPEYMVEAYLDGDEVSVESLVIESRIHHVTVTDKFKSAEPFFEEIGHTVPSALPFEMQCQVTEEVTKGIQAIGLNNCAVHTELRLTEAGPVIVEIAGRLGGDKIPFLVYLSKQVDMALATAYASVGVEINLKLKSTKAATIGFFVPITKQQIKNVPKAPPKIEGISEFVFWANVGDTIASPPEQFFTRLGYVIAVGKSHLESQHRVAKTIEWVMNETGINLCTF